jgi:hypothetical protein
LAAEHLLSLIKLKRKAVAITKDAGVEKVDTDQMSFFIEIEGLRLVFV